MTGVASLTGMASLTGAAPLTDRGSAPIVARATILATLAAAAILGLQGCSSPPPPAPPPAVVGADTLTVERLASWMVLGQPLPVTPEAAAGLASHWVEMMVVAGIPRGALSDPGQVERLAWPALRAARVEQHFAGWLQLPAPTPDELEEAYHGDELRLAAHVLRLAAPQAHPEEHERQREAAARIHLALTRGTPWEDAVQESEDQESRPMNGLLGLVRRGELDPALERVVFTLRPGEISGVVAGALGYHVVYRPRLEDVRPIFTALLQEERVEEARALYALEMTAGEEMEVAADGPERLRRLAAGGQPGNPGNHNPLATWEGGVLQDSVALRYLGTLELEARAGLGGGSDLEARSLLGEMVRQELLWTRVESETPPLSPEARDSILSALQAELATILEVVGEGPGAGERVGRYMDAVIARRREPLRPPALLVSEGMAALDAAGSAAGSANAHPPAPHPTGVAAAVERARRLLQEAGVPEGEP